MEIFRYLSFLVVLLKSLQMKCQHKFINYLDFLNLFFLELLQQTYMFLEYFPSEVVCAFGISYSM